MIRDARTRAAMSETHKAQWADPEYRARMLAALAVRADRIRWTPDMDAMVFSMREAGHDFAAIAERVGVAKKTLMQRVDHLGISRRPVRR